MSLRRFVDHSQRALLTFTFKLCQLYILCFNQDFGFIYYSQIIPRHVSSMWLKSHYLDRRTVSPETETISDSFPSEKAFNLHQCLYSSLIGWKVKPPNSDAFIYAFYHKLHPNDVTLLRLRCGTYLFLRFSVIYSPVPDRLLAIMQADILRRRKCPI